MTHGSLFSGIGGTDLAAEWLGWDNVFHCEWIEYKRKFLDNRFKGISYGDISTTNFTIHRGKIDVLTGGFPCQDASIAKTDGKGQQGLQGERTTLFYEMVRAIREIRPKYVVAENVANILKVNGGADFRSILCELSGLGYNAEWRVCYASEVGAPHKRARLYLVAYPSSIRLSTAQTFFSYVATKASQRCWEFAGASIQTFRGSAWNTEPPTICLDDGVSVKLVGQQLHGYGNAIVPQIAYSIFKAIEQLNTTT